MWELTDLPNGKDRWWIKRYSPGDYLGIRPKGEMRKDGRGRVLNGPTIRPKFISLLSFSFTASGFWSADNRLTQVAVSLGPT